MLLAGALVLGLGALWSSHGDAREVDVPTTGPGSGGVLRVTKRGAGSAKHIYWVEFEGGQAAHPPSALYVGALPPQLEIGDRFDIVDVRGYVGRVTIASVESRPLACAGAEYRIGMGRFDGVIAREPEMPVVAIGPVGRVPKHARILPPDAAHGPQPPHRQMSLERLLIDMDGDSSPDLARESYQCTPESNGARTATCLESWGRVGGKWRLGEETVVPNCY